MGKYKDRESPTALVGNQSRRRKKTKKTTAQRELGYIKLFLPWKHLCYGCGSKCGAIMTLEGYGLKKKKKEKFLN